MQAILMSSYVILAGNISANSNDMVEWIAGFSQGREVIKIITQMGTRVLDSGHGTIVWPFWIR